MSGQAHFIQGQWIKGSGEEFISTDPASEQETWRGRAGTPEEVDLAVAAAAEAFPQWADRSLEERIAILQAFAEHLLSGDREFAEIISRETGKPRWESLTEVSAMARKIFLSIEAYHERAGEVRGVFGEARTAVRFKPYGVVAVFGPFNLPGHLPNAHIAPALVAGNAVVFKPSEQAPLVGAKMVELWEAAGLPEGVLNMVQGGRETGVALAGHPSLDGLFFTGSSTAGKAIHRTFAGSPEKILALEMGGNNPLVVYEVEDIDAAAYLTVQSAFITAGQRCTCARRLIVPRSGPGDVFINRVTGLIHKIRVGPYTTVPEPFMGPLISAKAADALIEVQNGLWSRGAESLVEMKRLPGSGAFLSPGLIDVTKARDRPDEEFFGPLLQLVRVADFDEAIVEANGTAYGLSAGLLSDNEELYDQFIRRARAGIINWNRQITGASGKMPFGGIKASGNNRPSGYYAVDYCSYPVASIEMDRVTRPDTLTPGIDL